MAIKINCYKGKNITNIFVQQSNCSTPAIFNLISIFNIENFACVAVISDDIQEKLHSYPDRHFKIDRNGTCFAVLNPDEEIMDIAIDHGMGDFVVFDIVNSINYNLMIQRFFSSGIDPLFKSGLSTVAISVLAKDAEIEISYKPTIHKSPNIIKDIARYTQSKENI